MQFLRILCLFLIAIRLYGSAPITIQTLNPRQIIFNSITKSGSTYIVEGLRVGLRYEVEPIRGRPYDLYWRDFIGKSKVISKQHDLPTANYMTEIKKYYNLKMVIHVRDPRQAIVSLAYHYNHPKERAAWKSFGIPENYTQLTWAQQLDWNIEHRLPEMLEFIQSWILVNEQEDKKIDGMRFLWTTYEELISDELALYHKILDFYNIPLKKFEYTPIAKTEEVLFRKGDVNEWRTALSEQQKRRVAEIIPISLLQRFGWEQ